MPVVKRYLLGFAVITVVGEADVVLEYIVMGDAKVGDLPGSVQ